MERKERERILGEWGVRGENVRERTERQLLERDLEGSPLVGKPLPHRRRNFRPAVDTYVVSLGGPTAYMRRLKAIELETEEHERRLQEAWRALADECQGDPSAFAQRWRRTAERWSFDAVNELIERHNRWYPAEARLPMDPRSGDFVPVGGKPYRRRPLDAAWVLERFPPRLDAACAPPRGEGDDSCSQSEKAAALPSKEAVGALGPLGGARPGEESRRRAERGHGETQSQPSPGAPRWKETFTLTMPPAASDR